MIVVSSQNGMVGIRPACAVLAAGGSALDAVETGIRLVEANPQDHSVGLGGYPNLLGEVELDASIMDGRDLSSGAVGAVRGFLHPITIARHVMEKLPHVLLVGAGAERFAAEMGCQPAELLTEEARRAWQERLAEEMGEGASIRLADRTDLWHWVALAADPERARGTVNLIAQDRSGSIAAGVSTSGWAWKYPGRLGDSPIVGAGIYADNRFGAATCTGMGEMAIRAGTARSLVLYLQTGLSLEEAGRRAITDLEHLGGRFFGRLSIIALDPQGRHAGFSNAPGGVYLYLTPEMGEPAEAQRIHIPTRQAWG